MGQLLVRNLDEDVKQKLQRRARLHGVSTEEEIRQILRDAVKDDREVVQGLGSRIAALVGDLELEDDFEELRGGTIRPAEFDP